MSYLFGFNKGKGGDQQPPVFPPPAGAGGPGGGDDDGKNPNKSRSNSYSFDSSALERAAQAAKILEKSCK